jgi:hypothetical protein
MTPLTKQQIDTLVADSKSLCTQGREDVRKILYAQNGIKVTPDLKPGQVWTIGSPTTGLRLIVQRSDGRWQSVALSGGDGIPPTHLTDFKEFMAFNSYEFVANSLKDYVNNGGTL